MIFWLKETFLRDHSLKSIFRLVILHLLFILDLVDENKEDPKNKQSKIKRIQKNKSTLAEVEKVTSEVTEAVKLPKIDTKKGRGRKPKSAETTEAAQDTNNVTIEEFVPALVRILQFLVAYLTINSTIDVT